MGSKFQEFDKWPFNTGPLKWKFECSIISHVQAFAQLLGIFIQFSSIGKVFLCKKKKVPVRAYFYLNTTSFLATLITSGLKPNK